MQGKIVFNTGLDRINGLVDIKSAERIFLKVLFAHDIKLAFKAGE